MHFRCLILFVKDQPNVATLEKEARIAFIGFSLFDVIHLTVAMIVLIYSYSQRPVLETGAFVSSVELCFVVLLSMFDISMIKRSNQKHAHMVRRNFGYCCLLASMAIFVPSTFLIPEIVHGDWSTREELPLLILGIVHGVLSFLAMFFFAFAQLHDDKADGKLSWRTLARIGNVFFILAGFSGIALTIVEAAYPDWLLVFDTIGQGAPLIPGALIFWRLRRHADYTDLY